MKRLTLLLCVALLGGCSSYRPWLNAPTAQVPPASYQPGWGGERTSIVAAVTMSGGGARAAAFGLGVLRELRATTVTWEGRKTTVLDQVGTIGGVSGGSILAAYYAAFGDATFTRFEPDFLLADFADGLIQRALSPTTLYQLSSPWFGRSHVLGERLDALYGGRTFGDLRRNRRGPDLLVTATDLTTGAPFEFTQEQFSLLCSDLDSVPLSFAVTSSSAVPIVLTPMTLRNYSGQCAAPVPARAPAGSAAHSYRSRMLQASADSYRDARERPYVHLVDGGLADNLGVRVMLDHVDASGSMGGIFRDAPAASIRRLVLISINSERDTAARIDQSDTVPLTGQVGDALLFGVKARETQQTLAMLNDDERRWAREMEELRGTEGSPFAPDAEIHVISVSLRDVQDAPLRSKLLQVPTAFTIRPAEVEWLQAAGREVLRASPEFQRLVRSLDGVEKIQ